MSPPNFIIMDYYYGPNFIIMDYAEAGGRVINKRLALEPSQ